jgi:hypothetical protein
MPDVYLTIATADADVQERLAEILELRATDSDQRAMLERYTGDLELRDDARILEVGCGRGRWRATSPRFLESAASSASIRHRCSSSTPGLRRRSAARIPRRRRAGAPAA